uniref:Uncharacterized protein n=1 Tax=Triticum urartu TaxID=4572 RepID=A0A8R7TXS9_TRIUA
MLAAEPSKVAFLTSTRRDFLKREAMTERSTCRSTAMAIAPPRRTVRSISDANLDGKSAPVSAAGSLESERSKASSKNGRLCGSARRTRGGKSTRSTPVTSPTPATRSASTACPAPAARQRTREEPRRRRSRRSGSMTDAERAALCRRQRGEDRSLARRRSGSTTRRDAASQRCGARAPSTARGRNGRASR